MGKKCILQRLLLFFMVVFICGSGARITASADDVAVFTGKCGDDLTYEQDNEKGTLTVSGSGKLVISEELRSFYSSYVKTIYFPKGMDDIDHQSLLSLSNFPNLTAFVVEEGNEHYTAVDGVLYTKDMTKLLAYPNGKAESSFVIPATVYEIYESAFQGSTVAQITLPENLGYIGWGSFADSKLTSLTLPQSMTGSVNGSSFMGCDLLTEFVVEKGNNRYYSVDGVLYGKDYSGDAVVIKLICYPAGKTDTEFEVPSGVSIIGSYSMVKLQHLKTVKLPLSVTKIDMQAFDYGDNNGIENYYIPSTAICEGSIIRAKDGITIYGKAGSDAERYAKENNIAFKKAADPAEKTAAYPFVLDEYGNVVEPPSKEVGESLLKLSYTSLTLQVKQSTTVLRTSQMAYMDSVKKWESSNKKVVVVDAATGKLTAKKKGSATITVTMQSGAQASCKVTVQNGAVKTKKLELSKTNVSLKVGKTYTLKVTRTPVTSAEKLTFTSSDVKIATVSEKGKITAKKKGKVTITVATESGIKVTCKVTVK